MGQRRKFDADRVGRSDNSSRQDNGHDATLANDHAIRSPIKNHRKQARHEVFNLPTGIAQAGDFQHYFRTNPQQGAARQPKQINPLRGDILAKLGRANIEALGAKLIEQFGVDQMDLPQIGLRWVRSNAGTVFDSRAFMNVAFDTLTGDNANFIDNLFGKAMIVSPCNRNHASLSHRSFPRRQHIHQRPHRRNIIPRPRRLSSECLRIRTAAGLGQCP
jgi:hypothetical protein